MKDHYDVGILGVWYGCNYGSIATYYALQQTIEKLGYSTLMVHYPRLKPDDGRRKGLASIRFAEEHYDISPSYHVSEIGELNKYCDAFVLGSDQLWNYGVTKIFGHSYFLDFAGDDKKKIAYATSFGSGDFQAAEGFHRESGQVYAPHERHFCPGKRRRGYLPPGLRREGRPCAGPGAHGRSSCAGRSG